jgi:hypothetical protein
VLENARKALLKFLHRAGYLVRQEEKRVCKCRNCTHWEIVRGWRHAFVMCVACGFRVEGVIEGDRIAQDWIYDDATGVTAEVGQERAAA